MSFFTRSLILFVLFFSFVNYKAAATIRYVKAAATGGSTGADWANATADLQAMINASTSGDEVWVAAGTYLPTRDAFGSTSPSNNRSKTFLLKDGVKLYGGFAGNETLLSQRPAASAGSISVLSGDLAGNDVMTGLGGTLSFINNTENAIHVLLGVNLGSTTTLDGFTISGGNANSYGTISVGGRTLNNYFGGGLFNAYSSLSINNCEFKWNACQTYGGAIENSSSSCTISNTIIHRNYSASNGGAVFNDFSSNAQFKNVIVLGNLASSGTIFCLRNSNPSFINCTIYNNSCYSGGATIFSNGSSPTFTNCILWNPNSPNPLEVDEYNGGNTNVTYSIVKGGRSGTANSVLSPAFLNDALPEGADGIFATADDGLQLVDCSAAFNSGTNSSAIPLDILGVARPQFSTADMGAYESTTSLNAPADPAFIVTAFSCTSTTLLASGANSYLWSGGAAPTNAENIFTVNGTYTLTGYTALGCSTVLTATVALAPTITFSGSTTGCNAVIITAGGAASYLWNGGSTPADAINSFTEPGTYAVTATADNNCVSTDSITVTPTYVSRSYVDGDIPVSGDGSSWSNAFKTIQEAINICGVREVWVKAGTYLPTEDPAGSTADGNRDKTFNLKNGLKLFGGFAGTETSLSQRNTRINPAILSGDMLGDDAGFTNNTENVFHVLLSVMNDSSTVLDGFTIKGGNANDWNGLNVNGQYINKSSGGGVNTYTSAAQIRNCTLSSNTAADGGGMYNTSSTLAVSNTVFTGNVATGKGGGMYSSNNSDFYIANCSFITNVASRGAGIYNEYGAHPNIINSGFSLNNSSAEGGGIYIGMGAQLTLQNSIVWNNTASDMPGIYSEGGNIMVSNSDVQGYDVYTGTGNVNIDPVFVNAALPEGSDGIFGTADDGMALQNTSPLLDAGIDTPAPALDILGNSIYNLTRDMGAYEQLQGQDVYASVPDCQSISINNVIGNQWFYFRNASGIVAAINPNGSNLGTVTASINDATGAINFNAKNYVGRSVDFTSSNYAAGVTIPAAFGIRLYYYDTELAEYNTAASTANTINNMGMDWFQGGTGCDITTYAGNTNGNIATADIISGDYGAAANGFFLQFNLDHFTIFAPTAPAAVLPLNLLSFTGVTSATGNNLKWEAANEVNSKNFIIQRSFDGRTFTAIATQNANAAGNYFYTDAASNIQSQAIAYYRLKMVDNNGRYTYSNIIRLTITPGNGISVYPNPVTDKATLYIPGRMLLNITIQLSDLNGKLIKTFTTKQNFETIDMSALPSGVYLLQTSTGETLKVIKV